MSSQGTASGTSRLRSPSTWALITLVLAVAMTFLSLWHVPGAYAPDPADPDNLQTQFTHTGWVLASALSRPPHSPSGRASPRAPWTARRVSERAAEVLEPRVTRV
jgi:hypothetical protein